MTSEEAMNLLDQAAGEANTNRKNHDLIKCAVTVLRSLCKAEEDEKSEPTNVQDA